jgi:hypothetical protein
METVELNGEQVPRFISGQQAGFNPESGKWHDVHGRFAKREDALRTPREWGRFVRVEQAPMSRYAEQLELLIGGMDVHALRRAENLTEPMPGAMRAMMRLAEFYIETEGDVFQTIEVPLDIALKPLEIQSPDTGFQSDLEELYNEQNLDMLQQMYYIWLCSGIYGQAFPLLIVEKDVQDSRVVLIPPKNVDVGRSFSLGGGLAIAAPGQEGWTKQLLEAAFPPMVYNRYRADWNEQVANGQDIVIPQSDCFPVREKSLPFQRYAVPPVYRASRALSTRRIFEEMRRATVEGYKNQLWYFRYGDPSGENMPLPEEIQFLADQVEGLYGERTGVFVWEGRLDIQVIAPQAMDSMMANETFVGLTMEVFRKLGISLKVVSGERGPLGGSQARVGDMELDVSILLERVKFKISQMLRWERLTRARLAERMGPAAVKANAKTTVETGRISMEVERQIRERLLPAYQAGPLSIQTFLQQGGWDWAVELQRKTEEQRYRQLFSPPASFSQMVVGPKGQSEKTVEQTPSPGRPRDQQNPEVQGQLIFGALFDVYVGEVYGEFDRMVSGGQVDDFIAALKEINRQYMYDFAREGYRSVGGAFDINEKWIDGAIQFVNSYADKFGQRLEAAENLEDLRWNAYLYPQEGRHLAFMYGVQQAMRERGAKAWQRILHPELSETGPCELCIADSLVVHPIEEPFFEPHPGGVCSAQGVAFYTAQEEPLIEVPIPEKIFDAMHILSILRDLGRAMGQRIQQIVRRVRS